MEARKNEVILSIMFEVQHEQSNLLFLFIHLQYLYHLI